MTHFRSSFCDFWGEHPVLAISNSPAVPCVLHVPLKHCLNTWWGLISETPSPPPSEICARYGGPADSRDQLTFTDTKLLSTSSPERKWNKLFQTWGTRRLQRWMLLRPRRHKSPSQERSTGRLSGRWSQNGTFCQPGTHSYFHQTPLDSWWSTESRTSGRRR